MFKGKRPADCFGRFWQSCLRDHSASHFQSRFDLVKVFGNSFYTFRVCLKHWDQCEVSYQIGRSEPILELTTRTRGLGRQVT